MKYNLIDSTDGFRNYLAYFNFESDIAKCFCRDVGWPVELEKFAGFTS